jgi:hypothetical protein
MHGCVSRSMPLPEAFAADDQRALRNITSPIIQKPRSLRGPVLPRLRDHLRLFSSRDEDLGMQFLPGRGFEPDHLVPF